MKTNRLAYPAPNAIPVNGTAQRLANRKAYPNGGSIGGIHLRRSAQIESGQVSRKMTAAILIHAAEIRMLEQMRRLRKFSSRNAAHG